MEQTIKAINFFCANDCEVTTYDGKQTTFDVWSNISNRYILQDANEIQFINFYESFKPKNK